MTAIVVCEAQVDARNVVPVWTASGAAEPNADALRPKLLIHVRTTARDSSRDQQFAQAIQRDAPIPANGGTLYVVNAPKRLTFYDDFSLEKLTQLYLGDITVKSLSAPDAARLEPSLRAGDRIYRYAP